MNAPHRPPDPFDHPVEIAARVHWVGVMKREATFQCHPYLIEAGRNSVLIDPGSNLVIDEVMQRVAEVVPLDHIRWIVCHHSDPDIAGGLVRLGDVLDRADIQLVTEWRADTLLRHYGHRFPVFLVEEHNWELEIDDSRALRFVLTPYLHFPGSMCSFETASRVLFSSDLFGGFTDGSTLVARDPDHFESIREFHEHYMPSREILNAGLSRIRREFPDIEMIAPQHGCVIPRELVTPMFEQLAELECGIFLLAREDLDVARLLRVSSALRRITEALVMAHDFPELAATTERILPDILPVTTVELYVETELEGWLRLSRADQWIGAPIESLPDHVQPSLELPLPGVGARALARVGLREPVDITDEMVEMFGRLGPALRIALERHLHHRAAHLEKEVLYQRSRHDALTGLYNRHKLENFDARGRRLGVLMIDIDHFKWVNDQFGHDAGDEVLRRVAATIVAAVRDDDITIRHGGEEVLVLLDDADEALTELVGERVRIAIEQLDVRGFAPADRITVSVGAALHRGAEPLDDAVRAADAALYEAKSGGRNRVEMAWRLNPTPEQSAA